MVGLADAGFSTSGMSDSNIKFLAIPLAPPDSILILRRTRGTLPPERFNEVNVLALALEAVGTSSTLNLEAITR